MELRDNIKKLDTNVDNLKDFTIQASAKAFQILSDKLYSDKIKAVIRELSTNAYDAHIAVNKPKKPFQVTFPSLAGESFIVRDYGPGMDEDEIMELYSSYFGSNKNTSNDFVGALGLGSKSPFAYTDSFVVTSWNGCMKKSYVCEIASNGTPKIGKLFESECGKETGLEVKFTVNTSRDVNEFVEKAKEVYRYFKVIPNTLSKFGDLDLKINSNKPIFSGRGWRLYKNTYGISSRAVMGNIAYPINSDRFPSSISSILSSNIEIEFNIGELDIAPSREHLSYDEVTIENIKNKVEALYPKIKNKIKKSISDSPDMYHAKILYNELSNDIYKFNDLAGNILYKRKQVSKFRSKISFGVKKAFVVYKYDNWGNRSIKRDNQVLSSYGSDLKINPDNNKAFVYNDLQTTGRGNNKARALVSSKENYDCVYIYHPHLNDNKKITDDVVLKDLGINSFIKASSITYELHRKKPTNTVNYIVEKCKFDFSYYSKLDIIDSYKKIDEIEFDKDKINIAIVKDRNSFYYKNGPNLIQCGKKGSPFSMISYKIMEAKNRLELFKDKDIHLYIVKKAHIDNKNIVDNTVPFLDYFRSMFEKVSEKIEKDIIDEEYNIRLKKHLYDGGYRSLENHLHNIIKLLPSTSNFVKICNKYESINVNGSVNESFYAVYNFVYGKPYVKPDIHNDIIKHDTIKKLYPMVNITTIKTYSYSIDSIKILADYIKMVDKK